MSPKWSLPPFLSKVWRALVRGTGYAVLFFCVGAGATLLTMWMKGEMPKFSIDDDGVRVVVWSWMMLVLICFWGEKAKRQ